MNHNLQIQKILLEVGKKSDTKDRIKLLKQAINIADGSNDLDWGYELRSDLMYLEKGTSHCQESIPAFVWILDAVDTNPDLFDENDILLKYKWMILAAQRNTVFTGEQLDSIREDFRKRMEKNGHGLYTYYNLLFIWYMQSGNFEEARRYKDLREAQQPDSISYCLACDIDSNVKIELLTGDFDKAIILADELLSGRETCYYEPFSVLAKLVYYLALNKDSQASVYYDRLEEEFSKLESESQLMLSISYMIFYTSLFNRERAWSLFEKYSCWDIDAEDYPAFYFAVNLLPLLKRKDERKLVLSSDQPYFDNSDIYDTQILYNYYLSKARELGGKFDARNGNDYFSSIINNIITFC